MEFLTEAFGLYIASLDLFLEPTTIMYLFLGGVAGFLFGVLPGLTSVMGLALMLPITFWLRPEVGIIFLISTYACSVFAGSITAILINVPGTPSAIVTGLDGYPMAQKGEAGRAIGAATISSAIGGLFGLVLLVLISVPLADVALKFGSWEFSALIVMGVSLIAYISGRSLIRGMIAGVFGLLVATIGMDPMTAYPRFVFGAADILDGFEVIPVMIGIFGVAEVLKQIETASVRPRITQAITHLLSVVSEVVRMPVTLLRSSIIGVIIGAIPGVGPGISAVTSYGITKQFSKRSKELGTGVTEGVVAAESANNACVGGALIPLLTLGIPGDVMTAVLLGALMFHGLTPGPMLFVKHPGFISAAFLSLTLASFLLIPLFGLGASRLFAKILATPVHILMPLVLLFCIVGAFAMRNSLFDVGVAVAFGFLGYLMNKVDIPVPPFTLGLILGPLLEDNFRRSLLLAGGSFTPFFTRPIPLSIIVATLVILLTPFLLRRLRHQKHEAVL